MMLTVIPVVIDASALRALQQAHPEPGGVVVADVRWYLDGRDGRAAYESAHLPGAVWVDLHHQLADLDAPEIEGRHPFPTPEHFATAMGAVGIGDRTVVVAYDDSGGLTAGRLVVMLRMLGRDAAVLDGGLGAWQGAVDQGWVEPTPTLFTPSPWPSDRLASADETAALATGDGVVMDARARDRFTGEVTQIDPRPGHIPGAVNAPWAAVLDADGRFRPAAELRSHYEALGVSDDIEVVAYCGSGVSACMNIVAMEQAGFTPPRLYVASWSGWSADPDRPAEFGE